MLDPTTMIPDALPLTQVPWLDAVLKILGALTVLLTVLSNTLPKLWPATQAIAKLSPDLRGIVGEAAAKNEAIAQLHNLTTVAPEEQSVGPAPAPPDVPTYPKEVAQQPPKP